MLKKFAVGALLGLSLGFSASLTDLLNAVQNQITDYEQQGLAIEHPYTYTVLKNYYKFGKLLAAYGLVGPATDLLELANCKSAPLHCKEDKYFLKNIPFNYFEKYKEKYPFELANFETSYNAYAYWWIEEKIYENKDFQTFQGLEGILRREFLKNFKTFVYTVEKPIPFLIKLNLRPNDVFILNVLYTAYRQGLIKKIVFEGPKGSFLFLIQENYLPPTAIYTPPYHTVTNAKHVAIVWVY